jgi:Transglycosylase SLT domain
MMWNEKTLAPLIEAAARKHGLDPAMYFGQLKHESANFNPDVLSGKRTSSSASGKPVGAIGIAQFMPATAREEGVDPRDVPAAIEAGARYMARLKKRFGGDEVKARQAYNWGMGNLEQHQKNAGKKPMPAETKNYEALVARAAKTAPATAGTPSRPAPAPDPNVEPGQIPGLEGWRAQLYAMNGQQADPTLAGGMDDMNFDTTAEDATMQDNMLAGVFSDNPQETPDGIDQLPRAIDNFLEKILTA